MRDLWHHQLQKSHASILLTIIDQCSLCQANLEQKQQALTWHMICKTAATSIVQACRIDTRGLKKPNTQIQRHSLPRLKLGEMSGRCNDGMLRSMHAAERQVL